MTEQERVRGAIADLRAEYLASEQGQMDAKYPHGIYMCNCGMSFHGHMSRDMHWYSCESNPNYVREGS